MASVSVYNMEGKETGKMVENLGDRKEPDMQDRVRSVLHSGKAAELYLLQHQEIIHSK